jgi:hypothetical protein
MGTLSETEIKRLNRGADGSIAPTVTEAFDAARNDGFAVYGIELAHDAAPISRCAISANTCLVVGNEAHGLSTAALAACDALLYVPQVGKVSVAERRHHRGDRAVRGAPPGVGGHRGAGRRRAGLVVTPSRDHSWSW